MGVLEVTALRTHALGVEAAALANRDWFGGGGGPPPVTVQEYALENTSQWNASPPFQINDWAGNPFSANLARTVEFWIGNVNFGPGQNYPMFHCGSGSTDSNYQVFCQSTDQIRVYHWFNDITYDSAGAFTSAWHHVAVTYDGTDEKVFVDGTEIAAGAGTGIGPLTTGKTALHILSATNNYMCQGRIFDVRIWNVARSGVEILANLGTTLTGAESGLVAYYPMNEGTGTPVDLTGNTTFTITLGATAVGPNWASITDPR